MMRKLKLDAEALKAESVEAQYEAGKGPFTPGRIPP